MTSEDERNLLNVLVKGAQKSPFIRKKWPVVDMVQAGFAALSKVTGSRIEATDLETLVALVLASYASSTSKLRLETLSNILMHRKIGDVGSSYLRLKAINPYVVAVAILQLSKAHEMLSTLKQK